MKRIAAETEKGGNECRLRQQDSSRGGRTGRQTDRLRERRTDRGTGGETSRQTER